MFLKYTYNFIRGYFTGLIPRTRIVFFTNPLCRRMVSITKEWMGETIEGGSYELNKFDSDMIDWQKNNIPRIQKNIAEYEEHLEKVIADKTQNDRI